MTNLGWVDEEQATATANTEIFHYVQDEGEKQTTARTTASANADPYGMKERRASAVGSARMGASL
jgi:hypothetical protein